MRTPVDGLPPNTKAMMVTIIIPIPFNPDLEMPNKNAPRYASIQPVVVISVTMIRM